MSVGEIRVNFEVNQLEKGVLTSNTTMSLDERFTHLRRAEPRVQQRGVAFGRIDLRQTASIKNRRLALQMSRRPAVVAALTRTTLQGVGNRGPATNGISRGNAAPFFSGRSRRSNSFARGARGGGSQLRRSQSLGRLSRSQSLQSLNSRVGVQSFRGQGGRGNNTGGNIVTGVSRGRARRSQSSSRMGRSQSLQSLIGVGSFRGRDKRGRGRGKTFTVVRGFVERRRGTNVRRGVGNVRGVNGRLQNNNNIRGRNSFRGRGRGARRGRGGRWQPNNPPPSKETLDKELDQYMSASRATLDKELDSYMNQTEEKWD